MNIRMEALHHTYAGRGIESRTVLDIAHWSVASGAQVLLRGISGSGKTTLLNVLAGLLPPTQGAVWLDEQMIYTLREAQRDRLRAQRIGYVFQIHLLVPTLSAVENVEMPLVFGGQRSASLRRRQALDLLEKVGLAEFAHHRPVQMSTGQRLRVAVARALVNRPALVLADEPTAALDSVASSTIMDLLQHICREQSATLLVASHDPALNPRFGQLVTLQAGQMLAEARTGMVHTAAAPLPSHPVMEVA